MNLDPVDDGGSRFATFVKELTSVIRTRGAVPLRDYCVRLLASGRRSHESGNSRQLPTRGAADPAERHGPNSIASFIAD
jgi:hypothetical protein